MTFDLAFRKQVKEVLEHLYDTAYLETHPLTNSLITSPSSNRATRVQKLRSVIKDAIETMRPRNGLPSNSTEWRSYRALRFRYMQGMSMGQVESELGISLRQLQREIRKGIDAVTSLLWEKCNYSLLASSYASEPGEGDYVQDLQAELDQWVFDRHLTKVFVLVEDILWMLDPLLDEKQAQIDVDLPNDLPPILIDATLTRQALLKLIHLLLSLQPGENQVLSITGRKANTSVELLLRFCKQAMPAIDTDDMNWHIAELLLERQGGTVKLERDVVGGYVRILLPGSEQFVVLVVDDNPAIHQLFERYLASSSYTVLHAFSGIEALEMVQNRVPDAITLDVMMADLDGWQVLRSLMENTHTAKIPVIVCSVLREPNLAISLGAYGYLHKPVERLQLQAELERIRQAGASPSVKPTEESPRS